MRPAIRLSSASSSSCQSTLLPTRPRLRQAQPSCLFFPSPYYIRHYSLRRTVKSPRQTPFTPFPSPSASPPRFFSTEEDSPKPSPILFINSFTPEGLADFRAELHELLNTGQEDAAITGLLKATTFALSSTPYQFKTLTYATLIYAYNAVADRLSEKGQAKRAEQLISKFGTRIGGAVFDSIAHTITYCAAKSNPNAAASVLKRMGPNPLTVDFVNRLMNYCGTNFHFALLFLEACRALGATPNEISYNNLLDVYWKFTKENVEVKTDHVLRHTSFCNLVLEKMRIENLKPNAATYTIINRILFVAHDYATPEVLRAEMKSLGVLPDVAYFNSLLALKMAQSDYSCVLDLYKELKELKVEPDQQSYSAVIIASMKAGKVERGEGLLDLMASKEIKPTPKSLNSFLFHFIEAGRIKTCEKIISLFERYGYDMDETTANRLMHDYLKRGLINEARKIESALKARGFVPSLSRPIEADRRKPKPTSSSSASWQPPAPQ